MVTRLLTAIGFAVLFATLSAMTAGCGSGDRYDSGTIRSGDAERGIGAGAGAASTTTMPRQPAAP